MKKIAPFILGAAAAYFTFGGSLALGGLTLGGAGGWGGAISSVVNSIGLGGSTLGSILGGAVKYAGYGALGGAATAAVTGGDIGEGAAQGALSGAITGGVMSGIGVPDLLGGQAPSPGGSAGIMSQAAGGMAGPVSGPHGGAVGSMGGGAAAGGGGFMDRLFEKGGWLERNAGLVGPAVAGLGEGILGGLASKDEMEAQERMQRMREEGAYRRDRAREHTLPSIWSPVTDSRGIMRPENVY